MASKGKKEFVYEGFTLPRLTIKKLLANNTRSDCELQTFHKQLDREKEELESDFSKTRSQLLCRALDHQMVLEGQLPYDDSSSDEEQRASEYENNNADNSHMTCWETTPSFTNVKDISSSQDTFNRNPRQKQPWAEKIAHFKESLAAVKEPVTSSAAQPERKISWGGRANVYVENLDTGNEQLEHVATTTKPVETTSKSYQKRKISWGGRANVYMENWDTKSEVSKASSEGNLSNTGLTFTRGDNSGVRVRKHPVGRDRSRSFSRKNSGLTKEALRKHSSSTSQHLTRRHTVCSRPKREELSPTAEESSPEQKPLSDLLPPIKLPPIYLQETKSKKQGNKANKPLVNSHVKIGVSKSLDTKYTTQDLRYCRYLRIKTTDNEEFPW